MRRNATPMLAFPLWLVASRLLAAPAPDENRLPPPATNTVDFARDIKPLLENQCYRCHGTEKPKSGFRLTDRASALKGGENGVDILPGQSAKSPLIHFVARIVPDMEMPPEGKGTPLSSNQVALLRAWIDQGVPWNDAASTSTVTSVTVSPTAGGTFVRGDQAKFRQLEWRPDGADGGLENFALSEKRPDGRTTSATGHVLRDDYRVTLDLAAPELGFTRFGFEQYRKYFEDAGGYYAPFSPPLYRLPDEPHLDIGKTWFEVGLTLPDWPRIVAGYEHQFRSGTKSMLTWGPVLPPGEGDPRNIYPASEHVDEEANVFRLDLAYSLHGFEFEDNLRAELVNSRTWRTDALDVQAGAAAPDLLSIWQQKHESTQIANTARVQKEIYDWWLAGAGYRYSWFDGNAQLDLSPQDSAGRPAAGSAWSADNIILKEVWQVANANSQFRIHPKLTATLGVQGEWKTQEGFGNVNLDELTADPVDPTLLVRSPFPATEHSTLDQETAEESLVVRHTGLPFTSIFAEARLKEEGYTRTADQVGGPHAFTFASDAAVLWQDYRIGFNSSPWTRVSFGADYRFRDRQNDYDYPFDPNAAREGAYPGFITARNVRAQEVAPRLVVRPANWLKATLTYQWSDADFRTTTRASSTNEFPDLPTPGGRILAGRNQLNTVSLNTSLTPWQRTYFSSTISYQNSRLSTAANGSLSVAPYNGDLWTVIASGTYVLTERTDLFGSYFFSWARYGQNNAAAGLPLGIDYDRHGLQAGLRHTFSPSVTGRLQYGYYSYNEPSSGHLTDFTAHQVLAVISLRW